VRAAAPAPAIGGPHVVGGGAGFDAVAPPDWSFHPGIRNVPGLAAVVLDDDVGLGTAA